MTTQQAIQQELTVICQMHGIVDDPAHLLSLPPQWIAVALGQLGIDSLVLQIISCWQQVLSDDEVLHQLRSLNSVYQA